MELGIDMTVNGTVVNLGGTITATGSLIICRK